MGEIKKQNTIVLRNLPSNLIEEKRKNINLRNNRVNKKYKRLKIYSIATTALFLLETITFVIVK